MVTRNTFGEEVKMLKIQADKEFKQLYPAIVASKDKGLKRMSWNAYVDGLHKEGRINDRQANTWTHPAWVEG